MNTRHYGGLPRYRGEIRVCCYAKRGYRAESASIFCLFLPSGTSLLYRSLRYTLRRPFDNILHHEEQPLLFEGWLLLSLPTRIAVSLITRGTKEEFMTVISPSSERLYHWLLYCITMVAQNLNGDDSLMCTNTSIGIAHLNPAAQLQA